MQTIKEAQDESKRCEQRLTLRAAGGDENAFAELVSRTYERALRVALGLLRNQEDAEDIVQEAYARAHGRLEAFRAESAFYTWLYRIVVNLSIDMIRKRRRDRCVHIEDDGWRDALASRQDLWPADRQDPFETVDRQQLRRRLEAAFEAMPDIHQSVLLLREVEGLSYDELSRTLRIKKGTVMSRLFHARRNMQRHLEDRKSVV